MQPYASWLEDDACPGWCAGEHPTGQHPDDRAHAYPLVIFPVITDGGRPAPAKAALGMQCVIDIRKYPGNGEIWVFLGDESNLGNGLCVTLESAMRLHRRLGFALAGVMPGGSA